MPKRQAKGSRASATPAKYLDATNFPGGVNTATDATAAFADDKSLIVPYMEMYSAVQNLVG